MAGLVYLIFVILFVLFLIWVNEKGEKIIEQQEKARIDAGIRYDKVFQKLYIERQNSVVRNLLSIQNHKVNTYKYDPVKLHIGSVTTGGVTVGGTYTTGGGTIVSSERSTRCELVYGHRSTNMSTQMIKEIVLSDELAAKAIDSPVKEFLDERNKKVIEVVKTVPISQAAVALARIGRIQEMQSLRSYEEAEGYPTKEKCNAIINWLSSPDIENYNAQTNQRNADSALKNAKAEDILEYTIEVE